MKITKDIYPQIIFLRYLQFSFINQTNLWAQQRHYKAQSSSDERQTKAVWCRDATPPTVGLTGSGLNSMGAGSLQLQMLPYPSTLLQKIFLLRLSSVSAQWHSASAGEDDHIPPVRHVHEAPPRLGRDNTSLLQLRRLTFRGCELHLGLQQHRVSPSGQSWGLGVLFSVNLTWTYKHTQPLGLNSSDKLPLYVRRCGVHIKYILKMVSF